MVLIDGVFVIWVGEGVWSWVVWGNGGLGDWRVVV